MYMVDLSPLYLLFFLDVLMITDYLKKKYEISSIQGHSKLSFINYEIYI